MLVLLIIFMVTAPMIQRGMDVNLPVSTPRGTDRRRARLRDACRSDTGRITSCTSATIRSAPTCCRSGSGRRWKRRDRQASVLRGDGGVQYQDLMDVFDRLKAAGVERVGLVAKLPGER